MIYLLRILVLSCFSTVACRAYLIWL